MRMDKKWIQIWYSWGDQESPVAVPDGVDPWEYLKRLIIDEVEVSQEEYAYGCTVWMYPDNNCAEIKYLQDESYCYYLITDVEEYEPDDSYFDIVRIFNE